MSDDPISGVIQDSIDVPKSNLRGYENERNIVALADADAVRSRDLTALYQIFVRSISSLYKRDTSSTSADNGTSVIVDDSGNRWTRILQADSINPRGEYDAGTTYSFLDIVTHDLASWIYINSTSASGNTPPTLPTVANSHWTLFAKGGDRQKIAWWDSDRPASGEEIVRLSHDETVEYPAGLTDSQAEAKVAATAEVVFTISKVTPGGSPEEEDIGTITFGAGETTGVFAAASSVQIDAGEILSVVAPDPRDATLSGVAATIVGYRNTT